MNNRVLLVFRLSAYLAGFLGNRVRLKNVKSIDACACMCLFMCAVDIRRSIQTDIHILYTTLNIIDQLVEVYFSMREVHKEFRYWYMENEYTFKEYRTKMEYICITNVFMYIWIVLIILCITIGIVIFGQI